MSALRDAEWLWGFILLLLEKPLGVSGLHLGRSTLCSDTAWFPKRMKRPTETLCHSLHEEGRVRTGGKEEKNINAAVVRFREKNKRSAGH